MHFDSKIMNKFDNREIIITKDGSATIHFPELNEQYHSHHGAIQEAQHVFIKNGFYEVLKGQTYPELKILEMGLGTGLNALLTYLECEKNSQNVYYTGIEAYPVLSEEINQLNYSQLLEDAPKKETILSTIHKANWEKAVSLSPFFTLQKRKLFFEDFEDQNAYDLIYFDAFGARVQPELWTEAIFQKMYKALDFYGVLVTYSAKGSVRRALQKVGFYVERLPGPPGKREMLRAVKNA